MSILIKILVVDDETFVRLGIKTIFDWNNYGFEIIGEAEDGVEATEIFIKHKPDIVLVDICMPRLNGLDFIKRVKGINPYCKFIILSCHNEFEYVREAMKLGARDFIMKTTIKRDEMLAIVTEVAKEIRDERDKLKYLNSDKEETYINNTTKINDFFNELIDKEETNELNIFKKMKELQLTITVPNLFILVIAIDYYKKLKQDLEKKRFNVLISGVANITQEILKQYANSYVMKRDDNEIVCFVSYRENTGQEGLKLLSLSEDIKKSVKEFLNISISLGVSENIKCFRDISQSYSETFNVLQRKFFKGPNSINFIGESCSNSYLLMEEMKLFENEFVQAFENLDLDLAMLKLMELNKSEILRSGSKPKQIQNEFMNILFTVLNQLNNKKFKSRELAFDEVDPSVVWSFEYIDEVVEYIERMIIDFSESLERYYYYKNKGIVDKVKGFINKNIGADITLNDAAKYVKLSSGYLSKVYKKETGENFIDYVIKTKINKAKSLIRTGEKVWTIAHMLGYAEVSSFSRIFKKVEGVSPWQYRMQIFPEKEKQTT